MKVFRGCDLFLIAEIISDDKNFYSTQEPFQIEGLQGVVLPATQEVQQVAKDGKPFNTFSFETGSVVVQLNSVALTDDLISYLLGKNENKEEGFFIDSVENKKKYFALGFRTLYSDGSEKYTWYQKGIFNLVQREIQTKDGSTNFSGMSLLYYPESTIHKFSFNNKICRSVTVESSNIKRKLNNVVWSNVVWTPDNIAGINKPIIYPDTDELTIGDVITISSEENNEIEYEIVEG